MAGLPDGDRRTERSASGGTASESDTFYAAVGGEPTFRRLVDAFYSGVAQDAVLRPLYPEDELGAAADRLRMFLIQYWGGPSTYSRERGHPRLRMRHAPFAIDSAARDAWLTRMSAALDTIELAPEQRAVLWRYLTSAAESLRNTPG